MQLLCYKLGALFSMCQMHCLGRGFTYPLTFHNGSQNGPIFSSPPLPVNSHHPDGSSLKTGEPAHIVTNEKYQSLLSWQPIDKLGEEGGRDTFFYYLSGDAGSFISYTLAADWALCRCCLWSVNQSVQAGRMSSEGLVGLLIINYSPHQQTHSVTGTLKPIAVITEANSIKSQMKRWEYCSVANEKEGLVCVWPSPPINLIHHWKH